MPFSVISLAAEGLAEPLLAAATGAATAAGAGAAAAPDAPEALAVARVAFTSCSVMTFGGNDVMITDAGVGALVALAGVQGAAYNARINLKSIKDADYVQRTGIEIAGLVEESRKIAGLVEHEVTRVIGQD